MPKKRGRGRPALPKGKASSDLIGTRVSPEERRAFELLAEKEGVTLSKWVRLSLLRAAGIEKG
jgi:predicted HicB family RNase H-like nuclease